MNARLSFDQFVKSPVPLKIVGVRMNNHGDVATLYNHAAAVLRLRHAATAR